MLSLFFFSKISWALPNITWSQLYALQEWEELTQQKNDIGIITVYRGYFGDFPCFVGKTTTQLSAEILLSIASASDPCGLVRVVDSSPSVYGCILRPGTTAEAASSRVQLTGFCASCVRASREAGSAAGRLLGLIPTPYLSACSLALARSCLASAPSCTGAGDPSVLKPLASMSRSS